jgi:phosphoribosylanthranilate isomerase
MGYHVRVKICGVTNEADARQAAHLGADAVGLNFAPESPRHIDPAVVPFVLRELPPFVEPVGVFLNRPLREVYAELHALGGVRTIQWHGQRRELGDPSPYRLIAAFPVRDRGSLVEVQRYLDLCRDLGQLPAALLLDGYSPDAHGGTGRTAPWDLIADFRPGVPVILAGGLKPVNVAEAVRQVRPYGVDVASGVEHSPGHKDPEKVRRFLDAARHAAAGLP